MELRIRVLANLVSPKLALVSSAGLLWWVIREYLVLRAARTEELYTSEFFVHNTFDLLAVSMRR